MEISTALDGKKTRLEKELNDYLVAAAEKGCDRLHEDITIGILFIV